MIDSVCSFHSISPLPALIGTHLSWDTLQGNSFLRGPQDVVASIMRSISPAFAADPRSAPTYPCATPHNLTFQIGGVMFPIDPRDFVSQNQTGDATTCIVDNVVATDPPGFGSLFRWSLGDNFFKSYVPSHLLCPLPGAILF